MTFAQYGRYDGRDHDEVWTIQARESLPYEIVVMQDFWPKGPLETETE